MLTFVFVRFLINSENKFTSSIINQASENVCVATVKGTQNQYSEH